MNCIFVSVFASILFSFFSVSAQNDVTHDPATLVVNRIKPRSQNRYKLIQMSGSTSNTHVYNMPHWYGTVACIPQCTQTFRSHELSHCLFGPFLECPQDGYDVMFVQGSDIANRSKRALLADYFYLGPSFSSKLSFKPTIQNFNLNVDLFLGLEDYYHGLYVRIYAPLTYTRWNLHLQEQILTTTSESNIYPAGYFTPGVLANDQLLHSMSQFLCGETIAVTTGMITTTTVSLPQIPAVTFESLKFARMSKNAHSAIGIPDIRGEIGIDFVDEDTYHVGINLQGAIPTGNNPSAAYLFAPQLGTGHWELGLGLTAHWDFWYDCAEELECSIWFDANITHFFTSKEHRAFDLKGKALSRYMPLAQHTNAIIDNLVGPNGVKPEFQFSNQIAPVANISTRDVSINIPFQADIVTMINISYKNWSFDIGYDFWARSHEYVTKECTTPEIAQETSGQPPTTTLPQITTEWMQKGTGTVYGFAQGGTNILPAIIPGQPVPLAVSQQLATVHNGAIAEPITVALENTYIDQPQPAFAGGTPIPLITSVNTDLTHISIQPTPLSDTDINFGPGTRGMSHTIFVYLSHNYNGDWCAPYIGIGGFAEFGRTARACAFANTNISAQLSSDYIDCALSNWSIFIKIGLSFN